MEVVAVQDANILIDCASMGLLNSVMEMPLSFQTTDLVWAEITDQPTQQAIQDCINAEELTVVSLDETEIALIDQRSQQYKGLSLEDCSAWFLAEKTKGILLTGDGLLRKKAQLAGVEVHGSLWLLQRLFDSGKLTEQEACEKISLLQSINPRLPRKIVEEMKGRWCR